MRTRVQYYCYEITCFFPPRFWTSQSHCLVFQCVKPQLQFYEHPVLPSAAIFSLCPFSHCRLLLDPYHDFVRLLCRKGIQVQNTHLWSGSFSQDQVLDWVHCATPRAISPAQLREGLETNNVTLSCMHQNCKENKNKAPKPKTLIKL